VTDPHPHLTDFAHEILSRQMLILASFIASSYPYIIIIITEIFRVA